MNYILYFLFALFACIGIVFVCNMSVNDFAEGVLKLIKPKETLRSRSELAKRTKKKKSLYRRIMGLQASLQSIGAGAKFTAAVTEVIVFSVISIGFCVIIKNFFLMVPLLFGSLVFPFVAANAAGDKYEQKIHDELEIAMSIITNSYMRRDDLVGSIEENLPYIKAPLKSYFASFVGEASSINANTKRALLRLRASVSDDIFQEWVDALIACQDNRALKGTLQPIISKVSELRLINNDLKTAIMASRTEYWMMVLLCCVNVPLLWLLNTEWLEALLFTTFGKLTYSICVMIIFVTMVFMFKFTKPMKYSREED